MSKKLIVNPNNEIFAKLMKSLAKAIRLEDEKLISKLKTEFAEYDTSIFYNTNSDQIRVLIKDCPPIDFFVSQFTDIKLEK
ncbi:MAG: hypothetical protein WC940_03370 [Candidatus Paceibacterota bacterium]|jgi:hypothetical protein